MEIPASYYCTCPYCGEETYIAVTDAHYYWLPKSRWKCPHCKRERTTEELQNAQKEKPK